MKNLSFLCLAIFLISRPIQAQQTDSSLKARAVQKMEHFAKLMEYLASPSFNMSTKVEIENILLSDYLASSDALFFQDLSAPIGPDRQIPAGQYLSQLKVLYPNGSVLKTGQFEVGKMYFNTIDNSYEMAFRCRRSFKGLNILSKKEVSVSKVLDYQVKITTSKELSIKITGNQLAEGPLNKPGETQTASETNREPLANASVTQSEDKILQKTQNLLLELKTKSDAYRLSGGKLNQQVSDSPKTKTQLKAEKELIKNERNRIRLAIRKERKAEKILVPRKINIRVGAGFFASDSIANALAVSLPQNWKANWNAKLDVQYKFYGLQRGANGNWRKAHTMGLFFNYGKQTGTNVNRLLASTPGSNVDVQKSSRGFFEAEAGIMLHEEFRLSGGAGLMKYNQIKDGMLSDATQTYYCFSAGLSPRIFSFLEMDFNLSGLLINGRLMPRATVNAVILLKTGKF